MLIEDGQKGIYTKSLDLYLIIIRIQIIGILSEKIENIDFIHLDEIDNTNNLYELAALIESCDVVITISNTTAHIAGALGKKTFLLLPLSGKGRFWYWSEFNGKNLWYASIKIFSQIKAGDWEHPIQKVKNELINFKLSKCTF